MSIPSLTDMKLYFSNKSALIRIICRTQQWSGIRECDVVEWLQSNFKSDEGKYLAVKILLHSLYYSEANLIQLLHHGIFHNILGQEIKEELIRDQNIYVLRQKSESEVRSKLGRTLFIPLLDKDKPSESGNAMVRLLTTKLGIDVSNTDFHFNVTKDRLCAFDRIIIIDDCIGSGSQIGNFWNTVFKDIKQYESYSSLKVYYLALVGYERPVFNLQLEGELLGLRIIICDKLDERNRVFTLENNMWNGQDELDLANQYFDNIEKVNGVNKFGFGGLDFSIFLHSSVPDWSLPIFWANGSEWRPLLMRKNSSY